MRSIKRIVSMILTVVMLLGMIPTQTVSALSLNDLVETQNETATTLVSNDDFSLQIEWTGDNSETALDINETRDVRNAVTLRVNYTCMNVRPEGYKASDLIITVKGIGDVLRSGTLEALVAADKMNSSNKTHDWSYSWNKTNDTYTFINNEEISGRSVLSGYFELTWGLESRDCENGYAQNDISASLYLPEGQPLTTSALSFSHNTTKDTFTVNIAEQDNMYGYQGLTGNIQNPDDYAWVKYQIGTTINLSARGAYSQKLVIDPDVDDIGSGAICLNPNLSIQNNNDGTYSIYGLNDSASQTFTLYVAYPKAQYETKTVQLKAQRVGIWYDEPTVTSILAEQTIDKTIPGDFSFSDVPGNVYDFWLTKRYYDHSMHIGDIYGPSVQNNYSDYFYMHLTVNADNNPYTAEMIADNFYITTQDDYRALNPDEYELTSLTIPSAQSIKNLNGIPVEAGTMSAEIYAVQNGTIIDPLNTNPYKTVSITNSSQTIDLPANTTAVAIVLKDVTDNIQDVQFTLNAKFNTKQANDNLESGKLIPVAFIRLYDQNAEGTKFGAWFNNSMGEDNYEDTSDLHLADYDKNTYGSYLDREKTEITFYGETPDYQLALVSANELKQVDRHYETTIYLSGHFSYDYTNPPDDYTLYTILPARYSLKGYTVPEDIYDIIQTSIPTTSIDVSTDYRDTGLTYIAMHFNQPVDGTVSASIPVRTDRNDSVKVYGVLMNHVPVDANVGSQLDNGKWSNNQALYSDLNNDGNSDEKLSYDSAIINETLAADSSQLSINKYIQSQYSDGFTQSAPIEFAGDYTYQLSIRTGNGKASQLVVTDILENAKGSEWNGFLKSVDLSQCEALGITGTVKYSTSAHPGEASNSSWTTDPTNARSIMVDFGTAVINPGTELNILIHMVAPNDAALENKKAYNTYHADFDLYDATRPGSEPVHQALDSSQTAASLTKSLETIIITKEDEMDGTRLKGAIFKLYDSDDPELEIATATTNDNGYAIFHYIPSGNTYILRETQAPAGYLPIKDQTIEVKAETLRLTISDPRKPGAIEINKNSELTSLPLENAEFAVFDKNTNEQVETSVFTDSQGYAKIENLPWGEYYLKEINAPNGYITSDETYEFSVTRESVEQTPPIFRINNDQEPTKLAVLKTDDQDQPLNGAILELVYQVNESSSFRYGLYVTDTNGRVDIEDLPYGSYILKEYRAPEGYEKFEDFSFTLQPDSPELGGNGYHTIAIEAIDNRKKGSVTIVKNDDIGNQIKDIEFTLYDQNEQEVGKAVTDEAGIAKIENLEWGSYVLKETNAPNYYEPNIEDYEIEITATNLDVQLNIVNTTKKGSVVMTKYDETETDKLEGAVYSLYSAAGEYLGDYTTGADGTLTVENLAWGSYYFKEKKAPLGYGLSDETIRFSINANNSTTVQELTATDKEITSSITVTKTIKADDINFANGNPTFIFKVKSTADDSSSSPGSSGGGMYNYYTVTINYYDEDGNVLQDSYVSPKILEGRAWDYSSHQVEIITYQEQQYTFSWAAGDPISGTNIRRDQVIDLHYVKDDSDLDNPDRPTDINKNSISPFSFTRETSADSNADSDILTFYKSIVFDEDYVKSHTDKNGMVSLLVTFTELPQGIYEVSELNTSRYAIEDITNIVNGKVQDDKVIIDLTEGSSSSGVVSIPTGAVEFINENYEAQDFSHTDLRTNILSERQKLTSISVEYADTYVDAGSAVDYNKLTVIANYDDGTSRILNSNEYHLDQTVFSTINGEYTITVTHEDNGIERSGDFTIIISNGIDCIVSLDATYTNTKDLNVGDVITPNMFTVKATTNTGEVRTLKPSEYQVLMPNEDTNAIAEAELNDVRIVLNIDNGGYDVSTTVSNIPAIMPKPILQKGQDFNKNIKSDTTAVLFTNATWPDDAELIDVSAAQDNSVVAWYVGTTMYVRAKNSNDPVIANENCYRMFHFYDRSKSSLTTLDLSGLDTSSVTNMSHMFYCCSRLKTLDLSGLDTSSVTDMSYMFFGCESLTELNLSGFDTSSVTNMDHMFRGCSSLTELDLSSFDTSSVTNMNYMLANLSNLTELDLSSFDTSSVTNMNSMFNSSSSLTTLDLSSFDTSSVTRMNFMFDSCSSLTELDLSNFDTSNVISMAAMFERCSNLTELDLSNFDTLNVISMASMFERCSRLKTLDLSGFDTSSVVNMNCMFESCSSLTSLDLSNFDTSNMTNTYDPSRPYRNSMFQGCKSLTELDLSSFDTSGMTDMSGMFKDCSSLKTLDLSSFDTSNVISMASMFERCSNLTKLDLSGFDTSNVTKMDQMFYYCYNLTELDLSSFDTSNVTSISRMFYYCRRFKTLDLSGFDTSSVTNMNNMFGWCSSLTELDLSSFDTSNVTMMYDMFEWCDKLSAAYARTQTDADKFNNSRNKPSNVNFIVKPAA